MSGATEFGATHACDGVFGNVYGTSGYAEITIFRRRLEATGGCFQARRISTKWHEDINVGRVAQQPWSLFKRPHDSLSLGPCFETPRNRS